MIQWTGLRSVEFALTLTVSSLIRLLGQEDRDLQLGGIYWENREKNTKERGWVKAQNVNPGSSQHFRTPQFIQNKFCKHDFNKKIHLINCSLGRIYFLAELSQWPCIEFMGQDVHGWTPPQLTTGGGMVSSEWNFRTIRFYESLLSEEVRPLHIV